MKAQAERSEGLGKGHKKIAKPCKGVIIKVTKIIHLDYFALYRATKSC
jgi:hypothetical protein